MTGLFLMYRQKANMWVDGAAVFVCSLFLLLLLLLLLIRLLRSTVDLYTSLCVVVKSFMDGKTQVFQMCTHAL